MLNQSICKRCLVEEVKAYGQKPEDGWTYTDEMNWEGDGHAGGGYVACPGVNLDLGPHFAKIKEPPPEWCPYAAEHVVSQEC